MTLQEKVFEQFENDKNQAARTDAAMLEALAKCLTELRFAEENTPKDKACNSVCSAIQRIAERVK